MAALRFEGFVIVSADGRLTDERHVQPPSLRVDADHRFFMDGLRRASVVVHGRNSGDSDPHASRRNRVIVTRGVATIAPHPDIANAALWNPDRAPFEHAAAMLGVSDGAAAVIGGASVFALFFGRYDVFWLSQAARVNLPGGAGVFPGVPPRTPDEVLRASGLRAAETIMLDRDAGVSVTAWRRAQTSP